MITDNLKNKTVLIDMDGTIADLYSVDGWLNYVTSETSTLPFDEAKPLVTEAFIQSLIDAGAKVFVLSMTPRRSSDAYGLKVAAAKRKWIEKHFPMLSHSIIIIKSCDNKNLKGDQKIVLSTAPYVPTVTKDSIIIDDCDIFLNSFIGHAYDPYLNKIH